NSEDAIGVSGNARGRPKGARNKRTQAVVDSARAGGELPLDYMFRIMRYPKASNTRRDEMAKTAAPYLHPKLTTVPYTPPQNQLEDDNTRNLYASILGTALALRRRALSTAAPMNSHRS